VLQAIADRPARQASNPRSVEEGDRRWQKALKILRMRVVYGVIDPKRDGHLRYLVAVPASRAALHSCYN